MGERASEQVTAVQEDNEERIGRDRPLRLGTRRSPLALAQAREVAATVAQHHGLSRDMVELVEIVATGDKVQDRALAEIGGKALWTKELDRALADGEIDAAVHSMKDVETQRPDDFLIAAMLRRADPRDRLIGAESLAALAEGATVGSASPRRKAQLLALRPDLDIVLLRGNVQTRLDKVADGSVDATLLAAAGLYRLGMDDIGVALSHDEMLPAVAQGAIGIETLADNRAVRRLLGAVGDRNTMATVTAERAFLSGLGADCHSPVAAHAEISESQILLTAELLSPDGTEKLREQARFDLGDVNFPRRMAETMLNKAPEAVRAAFGG